jgi:hypothetical protein
MNWKASFGLLMLLGVVGGVSSQSWAQQDQKGAAAAGEKSPLKAPLSQKYEDPKPGEKRYITPGVKRGGEPRLAGPAFNFWWPTNGGGFHLNGQTGRGIFLWTGDPEKDKWDVHLTFEYNATVGDAEGYVYWMTDYYYEGGAHKALLWFSSPHTSFCNRWQIMSSHDSGKTFYPLSCSN